jgi:hypothetical protein
LYVCGHACFPPKDIGAYGKKRRLFTEIKIPP